MSKEAPRGRVEQQRTGGFAFGDIIPCPHCGGKGRKRPHSGPSYVCPSCEGTGVEDRRKHALGPDDQAT